MTIIGIDLGTTNSACAIWRDGKVDLIPNRLGENLTPSVISVDKDGTLVVGQVAKERLVTHPDKTVSVFKRDMGNTRKIPLGSKKYTAPELSSLILRSLKEDAETFLGETVQEAVISVPAYFNDVQRKATIAAGELAGLKVERLINEPTAAAMAYGLHEKPENTQFMVVDLGGGTFDVSIMEYFDSILEVHSSAGDNFLGGEDFLLVLVKQFIHVCGIKKDTISNQNVQKIYHQMEAVKRALNSNDSVTVEPFIEEQNESFTITRDQFFELCRPLLLRIQRPIETAMRDARVKLDELDDVILVGGATRMQIFRSMIAKMFRRVPASNVDPDLVVVMGASIQAALKAKNAMLDDVVLTDVSPYSLGIGIINKNDFPTGSSDLFSPIIERNTTVPVSRSEYYYTTADNQNEINVTIYQGESRLVANNINLGSIDVKVPKSKKGVESIEVRFSYDMNGVLEVDVTVVSTAKTYYKMIHNSSNELSEKELQQSKEKLAKLKFHPRDAEENRLLLGRAERLYESRLGAEREEIKESMTWFEGILNSQDERAIVDAREQFSGFLQQLENDSLF